jgi:hypothetical protein
MRRPRPPNCAENADERRPPRRLGRSPTGSATPLGAPVGRGPSPQKAAFHSSQPSVRIVDMTAEFHCRVNDDLELKLLEQRHAADLSELVDTNRVYLRQWMPWVDGTQSVGDVMSFIDASVQQFAENKGYHAGIWFHGTLCGVIGHHSIDWTNRSTSWATGSTQRIRGRES